MRRKIMRQKKATQNNSEKNIQEFTCCVQYALENPLISMDMAKDLGVEKIDLERNPSLRMKILKWVSERLWTRERTPDLRLVAI